MIRSIRSYSMLLALAAGIGITAEARLQGWEPTVQLDPLVDTNASPPLTYYCLATNPSVATVFNVGNSTGDGFFFSPDLGWNVPTNGWVTTENLVTDNTETASLAVLPPILSQPPFGIGVYKTAAGLSSVLFQDTNWNPGPTVTPDVNAVNPSVALNGNVYNYPPITPLAIAVWGLSTPGAIGFSTYFDDAWTTPGTILGSSPGKFPSVVCDVMGNSVALWVNTQNTPNRINAATYVLDNSPAATGLWSAIADIDYSDGTFPRLKQDAAGNAVAVWIDSSGNVRSSSLPLGGSWSTPVTISTTANNATPSLAVDPLGNAVAVWRDGADTIYAAQLPFGGTWTTALALSDSDVESFAPEVAVDTLGNAMAVWYDENEVIQYALLPLNGEWGPPTQLSNPNLGSTYPQVGFTGDSAAVVVWQEIGNDENQQYLVATSASEIFPPVAPTNFQVTRIHSEEKKKRYYQISWFPSIDNTIDHYEVYQDGVLIATVPFAGPYFIKDHNVDGRASATFTLVAVNTSGTRSSPLTVIADY